jgi:PAS domain S-box-containing protein
MLEIGLGRAEGIDTETIVKQVIADCAATIDGNTPQAGIVYAGAQFNHQLMLDMINDAFPGIQLMGCTTAGDYSGGHGFSDDTITLTTLSSSDIAFGTGVGRDLSVDYKMAVDAAVEAARNRLDQDPALCLAFPEGHDIRFEPILKRLGSKLGRDCPVFGGAAGTHWTDNTGVFQFLGRDVLTDAMPILLISGPVRYAFSIANSWRPVGRKAVVTRAKDRVVYKIDDFNAVDFYRHYLGHHEEPAREFILAVYEPGRDEFLVRAPIQYRDDGSILFSESIPEGANVQLTEATRDDLVHDTLTTAESLADSVKNWRPAIAFAFSCAFRKEILGTAAGKEVETLKEVFPPGLPIVGFYSFGEIAPLVPGGESLAHGATLISLLIGPGSDYDREQEMPDEQQAVVWEGKALPQQKDFLENKLRRSELYRQRLESLKDFNASMHRRMIDEIDAARNEIQRKEAALRKSEEKFRRIVQTTGEGFVLMDEGLQTIEVNQAYCRMVGYPRSDIIGNTDGGLLAEDFKQYLISNRDRLPANEYRRYEGILTRKDGRQLPVLIHSNTLRGDRGELIGYMAFISDISEQKKALALAGEVQRTLLPQESPQVPGLDIAGRNVSCDEVGGDYYDFFWRRGVSKTPFSVAVGDITGHGVDAALLMTSARAFLRLHATQNESIAEVICAANQHLASDVSETGRFMTLFYMTIDEELDHIEWIRAGHEPAIVYDPGSGAFEDLKGPGIALGIDEAFSYQPSRKTNLANGLVIAIGTDGIWESQNQRGEMFGRERFKSLLRQYAEHPASTILNGIFTELDNFRKGRKSDDDITLVIIKLQKNTKQA